MAARKLLLASIMDENALAGVATLCGKPPEATRVAYFDTASVPEGDDLPWLRADKARWSRLGFRVRYADLREEDEASLARLFAETDAVYCSGGNTFFLLQEIRRSGFDRAIVSFLEHGGVYAWSSAGALVATPEIGPVAAADDPSAAPDLASTAGLRLVPFALSVHFREDDPVEAGIVAAYRNLGHETILLRDGAHVSAEGDTVRIYEV